MANSLLDFVMSLVRDPDAATRYAQDPSQAIADAHLSGVTSADVNSLIPVVSESFPAGAVGGLHGAGQENVWSSGAATAAFDAFSDHVPPAVEAGHVAADAAAPLVVDPPVDHSPAQPVGGGSDFVSDSGPALNRFDAGELNHGAEHTMSADDAHLIETFADSHFDDSTAAHHHPIDDQHFGAATPGFDIFG
jgi:hypothetical protein